MERIETLLLMTVAVCTLTMATFAGLHAADRSYASKLPVVKLVKVVVVAPAAS
ncbi:hypothetical protein BH10PSE17_BH10PSE17_26850 [soil metagenome]